MEGNSIPKAAFLIIKNFRGKDKPQRKHSFTTRQRTFKRARKLTLNAEQLHQQDVMVSEDREPISANPELMRFYSLSPVRPSEDYLEQGIPFDCKDFELEQESPLSSTRKMSEQMRGDIFRDAGLFQMDAPEW